jgi:hypothetical protein
MPTWDASAEPTLYHDEVRGCPGDDYENDEDAGSDPAYVTRPV